MIPTKEKIVDLMQTLKEHGTYDDVWMIQYYNPSSGHIHEAKVDENGNIYVKGRYLKL